MSNIQVKNVPGALHRKLRGQAARERRPLRELVLDALRREVAREDFRRRIARRDPVDLGESAGSVVDDVRAERSSELDA